MTGPVGRLPPGLARSPLFDALVGRRSRRFGEGMAIPDGPLAHTSRSEPRPLDAAKRAVLVFAAAGVTGWNLGMPHTASGAPASGCNYPLRGVGRTAPSAASIHSSEVLVADADGTWITRTRTCTPDEVEAVASLASLDELVEASARVLVRLGDAPLEFPVRAPFVAPHNRWDALAPGSTLLVPVTDMTEQFLTFLAIFTADGAILWDTSGDVPVGDPSELLAAGRLGESTRRPLESLENRILQMGTVDGALMAYNAQLALQAMGLGGWMYSGLDAPTLLGGNEQAGTRGFGFTLAQRPGWRAPNPVGLAGAFETLSPPFVASTEAAVERFAARKFGPGGVFDPNAGGPYRDNGRVKAAAEPYDDAFLSYLVSVLDGMERRFGGYPSATPAVLTSVYLQAQHVDAEYYDTHHGSHALLPTHRDHDEAWHSG